MSATLTTPTNALLATGQQWCDWLADQERIFFDEYQRRPNRLVPDFNSARTFITDYVDREILELLQNADDAAAKAGQRDSVHFELLPGGLIAANTGAPFSQGGVASLRLPQEAFPTVVNVQNGQTLLPVLQWLQVPALDSADWTNAAPKLAFDAISPKKCPPEQISRRGRGFVSSRTPRGLFSDLVMGGSPDQPQIGLVISYVNQHDSNPWARLLSTHGASLGISRPGGALMSVGHDGKAPSVFT